MTKRLRGALLLLPAFSALVVHPAGATGGQGLGPVGTMQTLAGPGFCEGPTLPDRSPPLPMRALAVNADGRLFVDQKTSTSEVGIVRQFDDNGIVSVSSGIALGRDSANPAVMAASPPVAGRLAPNGKGGVLIAAAAKVVDLAENGTSLSTLIGDPASATGTFSTGDGGPAAAARFKGIRSITTDEANNLYIADEIDSGKGSFRIRFYNRGLSPAPFYDGTPYAMVVAPGSIDTIAGGTDGTSVAPASQMLQKPDPEQGEGFARTAKLQGVPPAMSVVKERLYLGVYWKFEGSSAESERVQVINLGSRATTVGGSNLAAGAITTVYEGPQSASSLKNALGYAPGIAANSEGDIFLADKLHNRIVTLGANGRTTTFAGTGRPGFNGNARPATSAQLNHPYDVKIGPRGDLFISDGDNGRARVVLKSGEIRAVFEDLPLWRCGQNPPAAKKKVGPGAQAPKVGRPASPRLGADQEIYFVNSVTGAALKRKPSGVITPLRLPAGMRVSALAPRRSGGLYLLDGGKASIYLFNTTAKEIVARGMRVPPGRLKILDQGHKAGGDKLPAEDPKLGAELERSKAPAPSLAADGQDNLFATDPANGRVLSFAANGRGTILAGKGAAQPLEACCTLPSGIAPDPSGNVYVSDLASGSVWLINRGARPVRVHGQAIGAKSAARVAGTGKPGVGGEGGALENPLSAPLGLTLDRRGNLFIADPGDSAVRKVDPGGLISTIAGTGKPGFNGDGLQGKRTRLNAPTDVAVDECGNLLIADTGNDRIARFNLGGICSKGIQSASKASRPKHASGPNKILMLLAAAAAAGLLIGVAVLVRERTRTK